MLIFTNFTFVIFNAIGGIGHDGSIMMHKFSRNPFKNFENKFLAKMFLYYVRVVCVDCVY